MVTDKRAADPGPIAVARAPARGLKRAVYWLASRFFSERTLYLMWFDLLKFRARVRRLWRRDLQPAYPRLHLGAGSRRVADWLNVDVSGSDYDIDFTSRLPWRTGSFDAVVSEHVIEHLEVFGELLPLLRELRRVLRSGGEVWLSCPDMERICHLYVDGRARELVEDRLTRDQYSTHGAPPQQIVNDIFHQWGEHRNLLDFELLKWALESAGFTNVRRADEGQLLGRFPAFPARNDDMITLYVLAAR